MVKKSKPRRRRTITRQGIRRPRDTGETLKDLKGKQSQAARNAERACGEVALKRASILVAEQVFQWRISGNNRIRSDDHILDMARAVHEGGDPLEPILVLQVGQAFYVVDGHHRLAAYDTARWTKPIPASVFEGSLEDAHREALKRNSRTKLPMTKGDKISSAWTIVKKEDPRDSIRRTMALSGAGKGTVNKMRAVWKKLTDGTHGDRRGLMKLSWPQARDAADGRPDYKDVHDWREAEAEKIIQKLHNAKLIGDLIKNPDITALVLAKLDDGLPALLTAEWSEDEARPFDPHEEEANEGADF